MTRTEKTNESAVSPVVGVMLMLVVVIIIAAVVSGFSGSMMSTQKKVPQATIQGTFSISNGMQIIHAGGDPIALNDVNFIIRDNPVFGPNLDQATTQILNKGNITNGNGIPVMNSDGTVGIPSFSSGDTLYLSASNSTCNLLQPMVAPADYDGISTTLDSTQETDQAHWNLCLRNTNSVGKTFTLETDDKKGNLISRTDVTIAA
jgi:archaeal type IV pilus assembly protein PilA